MAASRKTLFVIFILLAQNLVEILAEEAPPQNKKAGENDQGNTNQDEEIAVGNASHGHGHSHGHSFVVAGDAARAQLIRYRVIAVVLECGIVVHSVVIGISLGASSNVCSLKSLVVALSFHQLFEGMGLGGCILQAKYTLLKKCLMAIFFATTTPFGIIVVEFLTLRLANLLCGIEMGICNWII
ncbi:hypothetical protein MKW92_003597 [Papaver armeniacum]|nr:hypothetical protein MKW92_003597 [Papaver armeniacum]